MLYPDEVIQKELMWRYGYTDSQAKSIIDNYKSQDKFLELCDLITYRMEIENARDNILIRYQG